MIIVLAVLSLGLLAGIVYFAVSPKSSRLLRLAAIAALGLICVSLVICGILLVRGPVSAEADIPLPFPDETAEPVKKSSNVSGILIIAGLVLVLGLVILKALRDQKKVPEAKKTEAQGLPASVTRDDFSTERRDTKEKDEEESFDIDFN